MEINPQRVRSAEFKTVRKGVDPDEVRVFLSDVADELERAQNQSTAMEARARAAVARLQELNESGAAPAPAASLDAEEAETISRTLLLAQRTADSTVAEARAEAARLVADAKEEAAKTLDSTRVMSARLIDEAREEARRVGDVERENVAGEVEALKARREFLESDVHHLEVFLVDQRSRVREAASALLDVVDRVPGGLGDVRAPLLSASDDDAADDDTAGRADHGAAGAAEVPSGGDDLLIVTDDAFVADDVAGDAVATGETPVVGDADGTVEPDAASPTLNDQPWADEGGDPTEAMPTSDLGDTEQPGGQSAEQQGDEPASEFRFSFDDERS